MRAYRLCLGHGNTWSFSAAPDARPWLREMARILRLKKTVPGKFDGHFFVSRKTTVDKGRLVGKEIYPRAFPENLPKTGWHQINLKSFHFFTHPESRVTLVSNCSLIHEIVDIIFMSQTLYPVYEKTLRLGGVPIHAALLEKQGRGIVLAAPGSTGKSTCARRVPRPWNALSDDEVMLVRNQSFFDAHPLPTWSEYLMKRSRKTWDVSQKTRLGAIFFLKQAVHDSVEPMGRGQASAFLAQSAFQAMNRIWLRLNAAEKRRLREMAFANACRVVSSVPAFILNASRKGRFWEKIENVLP